MAREFYKDWEPGEKLTAEHVNLLNRAARLASSLVAGSYNSGRPGFQSGIQPFTQRLFLVVDDTNQSAIVARTRYFIPGTGWTTDGTGDPFLLDASSTGKELKNGDLTTAWFDSQSGKYIPIPPLEKYKVYLGQTVAKHGKGAGQVVYWLDLNGDLLGEVFVFNRLFEELAEGTQLYFGYVSGSSDQLEIISVAPYLILAKTTTCHRKGSVEVVQTTGEDGKEIQAFNRFADIQPQSDVYIGNVSGNIEIVVANPCPDSEEKCDDEGGSGSGSG